MTCCSTSSVPSSVALKQQLDRERLLAYSDEQTYLEAGQGGFEVRTFIAVAGATEGTTATVHYYRPIPIFAVGCTVGIVNLEEQA